MGTECGLVRRVSMETEDVIVRSVSAEKSGVCMGSGEVRGVSALSNVNVGAIL